MALQRKDERVGGKDGAMEEVGYRDAPASKNNWILCLNVCAYITGRGF